MDEARKAMSTWLGALGRGGLLRTYAEEAGVAVAAWIVGEEKLSMLRDWMSSQPQEVVEREQRAAIEVCIWMARADRDVDPEERALLVELVEASTLSAPIQQELKDSIEDPPSLEGLEARLTHPALRELLLALSWELALSDERIDRFERDFYTGLSHRLGIDPERAREIQDSLSDRVGS